LATLGVQYVKEGKPMSQKQTLGTTAAPGVEMQEPRASVTSLSATAAAAAPAPSSAGRVEKVSFALNLKGPGSGPKLWMPFSLDDLAIVPGQAISFSLGITPTQTLNLGNDITVGLYEVNDQGERAYPQPSWLWSQKITADLLALKPYETLTIEPGPQSPQPTQFSHIYTVGEHNLAMFLTDAMGNDLPGGPYSSTVEGLSVVFESIDDSWWEWLDPQLRTFEWKNQPYQVNGRFHNKFVDLSLKPPTIFVSGAFSFVEVDKAHKNDTSESIVTINSVYPQGLSQQGQMDAVVSYVAKNWEWHMPGTYTPDGDIIRTYTYSVLLNNLKDQYGNVYPPRALPGIAVRVFVSDQKLAADGVAVGAFATWATFSLLATVASGCIPCAAVLSRIASGAATTLGIAGKIADDPPWEDPLYRQEVDVEVPELPPILTGVKRLHEVATLFQLLTRILACVDALNTVANRLAISRRASDERSVELHTSTYREILDQIARDAEALDGATAHALPVLTALPIAGHEKETLDPKLTQFSLTIEAEGILEIARRAPLDVGIVTTPPQEHVRSMATYARRLAAVVQRDASAVLAS
jgi:hypothetical protein